MLNKRYNEFHPNLQRSEELLVQVDDISKEIDGLKNTIENEVSVWIRADVKSCRLKRACQL